MTVDNYFFRCFAYKSLLSRFSVLINYNMWSSDHFSTSSRFPRFSGSRFFRVQVFQGLGFSGSRFFRVQVFQCPGFSRSGSRVRVQVLEVARNDKNCQWNDANNRAFYKWHIKSNASLAWQIRICRISEGIVNIFFTHHSAESFI